MTKLDPSFTRVKQPEYLDSLGVPRPLNSVASKDNYYLSYNPSCRDYGSDTTAIVCNSVFLVMNGNHSTELHNISEKDGYIGCVRYFIDNIHLANHHSEHKFAFGMYPADKDIFNIHLYFMNMLLNTLCPEDATALAKKGADAVNAFEAIKAQTPDPSNEE